MSNTFTRSILAVSIALYGFLASVPAFAQCPTTPACPAGLQPCNCSCIQETELCILEPLPGASGVIAPSATPFQIFMDYVNGTAGSPGLWQWAFRIGVAIAVLNGVFGGFQIVLSNGDSGAIDAGKKRFIGSALGLALLLLSGVILHFINPYGFGTSYTPALP